jgi:proprotein convertase subtilisin/kexin type 5
MQYLLNNQCVSSCGLGYFILSGVCKVCNSACYTCDGTLSNNCLSCNPLSLNKYYDSIQKTCNTTCISGYYNDDSLNKCLLCTNNCTTCSSIFNCSTCSNPYYFYNY